MEISAKEVNNPGGVVVWARNSAPRGRVVVWARAGRKVERIVVWALAAFSLWVPTPILSQESPDSLLSPDSTQAISESVASAEGNGHLPIYLVLGLGYGSRNDDCVLCQAPEDNSSFTGHLSLGRPLGHGFGIGVDVSMWRRGRPGTPLPADSTGIPGETSLTNTLGNLSVSFSSDIGRFFVRAGGGLAWGSQDLEMADGNGDPMIHTASGWGVGYSAGAGLTVPIASIVSISFFGNWNVGNYDMISPQGLTERKVKHEYLEFGVGLAIR